MVQHLPDGDARIRQLRDILPHTVIEVKQTFFLKDHDRHGSEHFRYRSQLECGGGSKALFALEIIVSVSFLENQPAIFTIKDAAVKPAFSLQRAENTVDDPPLFCHDRLVEVDENAVGREGVALNVPGRFLDLPREVKDTGDQPDGNADREDDIFCYLK